MLYFCRDIHCLGHCTINFVCSISMLEGSFIFYFLFFFVHCHRFRPCGDIWMQLFFVEALIARSYFSVQYSWLSVSVSVEPAILFVALFSVVSVVTSLYATALRHFRYLDACFDYLQRSQSV